MITENKFSKYFLYAIGEIILVVIGILIALSLNTVKEDKTNNTKITNILKGIQIDIENDIKNSRQTFHDYLVFDSIQDLIFKNYYTVEDFRTGKAQTFGYSYYDFIINTSGYDNLIRNLNYLPENYETFLANLNQQYVTRKSNIEVYNTRIRNTVYDHITYTLNQPWAHEWTLGIPNKEGAEYFLNDPHYKRSLLNYRNDRINIFKVSNQYRIEAVETYNSIVKLLNNKVSSPEIISLINKDPIMEDKLIGTYSIIDSIGIGQGKQIKISKKENHLYLNRDHSYNMKLYWHKDFIYFQDGGLVLNFNKTDTLIINNVSSGKAIFIKNKN
jgi:hypothetical protein